jgi:hypothetical protein
MTIVILLKHGDHIKIKRPIILVRIGINFGFNHIKRLVHIEQIQLKFRCNRTDEVISRAVQPIEQPHVFDGFQSLLLVKGNIFDAFQK